MGIKSLISIKFAILTMLGFGINLEMAMYGICAIGGLAIYRTVIIREKPDHQCCKFLQMQRRFVHNKVDNLGCMK